MALRETIRDTIDKDLRSRFAAMRGYLQHGDRDPAELADDLGGQAAAGAAGAWIRIVDPSGKLIYQSPATRDWKLALPSAAALTSHPEFSTIVVHHRQVRVLTALVSTGAVQIGIATDEFDEMLRAFLWTVGLASPILLLLAAAGGYWMSTQALKPVDDIARTAKSIGAGNLSGRIRLRGTGDELDRLSEAMNQMLARLEGSFNRVTQFTADASHELRTPVAIMRTTAEVIRARPRSVAEHEKAWDQIVTQTERTSRLIDDMLLLARADSGRDDLAFEPLNLTEVLRSVAAEVQVLAEASGLGLTAGPLPECSIVGDTEAIRRLLLILLDNAIKYTPPGGAISMGLSLEPGDGGSAAVIEVRDTGVGIAPDDLVHIFDRFYRTAHDRSRKTGGAGLGLSIAHWLVARHGGEISVESSPGAGSTFRITLKFMGSSESVATITR